MTEAQPPLPGLHDIVLPEPVSWAPQTVGWWVLLGFVVVVMGWMLLVAIHRRHASRYRRSALEHLAQIEEALADPVSRSAAVTALPILVKQTAMAFRPRSEVAALTGERWLRFLDDSCDMHGFTEGPGRLLPMLAYSTPATTDHVPPEELQALVDLVRQWIGRHRVRV